MQGLSSGLYNLADILPRTDTNKGGEPGIYGAVAMGELLEQRAVVAPEVNGCIRGEAGSQLCLYAATCMLAIMREGVVSGRSSSNGRKGHRNCGEGTGKEPHG